jgi:hypothetical protein
MEECLREGSELESKIKMPKRGIKVSRETG